MYYYFSLHLSWLNFGYGSVMDYSLWFLNNWQPFMLLKMMLIDGWIHMKSIASPTKCHQLLLVVSCFLSFEIAGTRGNMCTERFTHQNSSYSRQKYRKECTQITRGIYLDIYCQHVGGKSKLLLTCYGEKCNSNETSIVRTGLHYWSNYKHLTLSTAHATGLLHP